MEKLFQPYYLVTFRPWPLMSSFSIKILLIGIINRFNNFNINLVLYGKFILLIILFQWWRDVIRERFYQGFHSIKIVKEIKFRIILFILSEVFFFISIFWSYLHIYLSPRIELGRLWPPKRVIVFNPYEIPLLNTIILLSSGITVTWSHYSIIKKNYIDIIGSLLITLILGLVFSLFQYKEYIESFFSISDSVYGAVFFISTGFHGLHVLIGIIFLLINYKRIFNLEFSSFHHLGFELAAWYWHFVDIVWLFLFLLVYFLSR